MHFMLLEGEMVVALLQDTESDGSQDTVWHRWSGEAENSSSSDYQKRNMFLLWHDGR